MNNCMDEKSFQEAYVRMENKVTAGTEIKEKTKALVLRMEARSPVPTRKNAYKAPERKKAKRLLLAAACLVLTACLIVAGGLFGREGAGDGFLDETVDAPSEGALTSVGNFFTLVAYADETTERTGDGVALGLDVLLPGAMSAGHRYDSATDTTDRNTVDVSIAYQFNLAAQGTNIDSLEYSISGPDAAFVGNAAWYYPEGTDLPQESPGDVAHTSFTLPFEDDESMFDENSYRVIRFDFTLDKDIANEYNILHDDRNNPESFKDSTFLLYKQGSERLCRTLISVTATFEDGTQQTKTYGFEPADKHDEILKGIAYGPWPNEGDSCLFVLVEK